MGLALYMKNKLYLSNVYNIPESQALPEGR